MRQFLCRSHERKHSASHSVENIVSDTRRSLSDGMDTQFLGVPLQNKRWGSLTNLTVPDQRVRRRSYSGPITGQQDKEPFTRRHSTDRQYSKDKFNPLMQKYSNRTVMEFLIGMVLIFIVVLIVSLFRLIT